MKINYGTEFDGVFVSVAKKGLREREREPNWN